LVWFQMQEWRIRPLRLFLHMSHCSFVVSSSSRFRFISDRLGPLSRPCRSRAGVGSFCRGAARFDELCPELLLIELRDPAVNKNVAEHERDRGEQTIAGANHSVQGRSSPRARQCPSLPVWQRHSDSS